MQWGNLHSRVQETTSVIVVSCSHSVTASWTYPCSRAWHTVSQLPGHIRAVVETS